MMTEEQALRAWLEEERQYNALAERANAHAKCPAEMVPHHNAAMLAMNGYIGRYMAKIGGENRKPIGRRPTPPPAPPLPYGGSRSRLPTPPYELCS